jgi:anaerobic magnesium-protoporphyrin IX monomethyl ester cyclase
MKVLLINPISNIAKKSDMYFRSVSPLPPSGVATLAAVLLNAGIEVFIEDQYATRMENEELVKKIKELSPEIIGISCLTTAMGNVEQLVAKIRSNNIKTTIVVGNIHPTLFPEETLTKGIADIIVRGEGEMTLLEIVRAIEQGGNFTDIKGISYLHAGKVIHNEEREIIADLDILPYPAWNLLDLTHYTRYPMLGIYNKRVLPIQGSRGCPYSCLFCSQDKFYKKPRYRKIKNIVDEIEYLYNTYQMDAVGFNDAYFPFTKETGIDFCDELIKRGLHKKITWFTETRVDMVDLELMKKMKQSNCTMVMFGFEVGNRNVLEKSKKQTTLEQAKQAVSFARKCKIRTMGLFMLGLPNDTRETCLETIAFAKKLDPFICKFNIAVPYPGSKFFEDARAKLKNIDDIKDKLSSWYDWSSYEGEIVYCPEAMDKRELVNLQRLGMIWFYMRPKILLRYLISRPFVFSDFWHGALLLLRNCFLKDKRQVSL